MEVKKFENRRWQREDQNIQFRHKTALTMVDSSAVLDLGSGDGLLLSLLKDKGIKGKGLDLSEEGVAKANAKGLDTQVFDLGNEKLPFPESSFDTVVMLDILEHLYDPEFVLKEATRVSKKYVIVGVPNFSSLPARLQVFFGMIPENNQPKKGHVYWFNYGALVSMLSKHGLSIDRFESNTFFEHIPVIGLITRFFTTLFPNLFSLSFVVKAKKV